MATEEHAQVRGNRLDTIISLPTLFNNDDDYFALDQLLRIWQREGPLDRSGMVDFMARTVKALDLDASQLDLDEDDENFVEPVMDSELFIPAFDRKAPFHLLEVSQDYSEKEAGWTPLAFYQAFLPLYENSPDAHIALAVYVPETNTAIHYQRLLDANTGLQRRRLLFHLPVTEEGIVNKEVVLSIEKSKLDLTDSAIVTHFATQGLYHFVLFMFDPTGFLTAIVHYVRLPNEGEIREGGRLLLPIKAARLVTRREYDRIRRSFSRSYPEGLDDLITEGEKAVIEEEADEEEIDNLEAALAKLKLEEDRAVSEIESTAVPLSVIDTPEEAKYEALKKADIDRTRQAYSAKIAAKQAELAAVSKLEASSGGNEGELATAAGLTSSHTAKLAKKAHGLFKSHKAKKKEKKEKKKMEGRLKATHHGPGLHHGYYHGHRHHHGMWANAEFVSTHASVPSKTWNWLKRKVGTATGFTKVPVTIGPLDQIDDVAALNKYKSAEDLGKIKMAARWFKETPKERGVKSVPEHVKSVLIRPDGGGKILGKDKRNFDEKHWPVRIKGHPNLTDPRFKTLEVELPSEGAHVTLNSENAVYISIDEVGRKKVFRDIEESLIFPSHRKTDEQKSESEDEEDEGEGGGGGGEVEEEAAATKTVGEAEGEAEPKSAEEIDEGPRDASGFVKGVALLSDHKALFVTYKREGASVVIKELAAVDTKV